MAPAQQAMIKIVGISGSLRSGCVNSGLIRAAKSICNDTIKDVEFQEVKIMDLPLFNFHHKSQDQFPDPVEKFRQDIKWADAFLFASPQYNYSISGPLKNAIDWAYVRENIWAKKTAAVVSAGGDVLKGLPRHHMCHLDPFLDLRFINNPDLFVPEEELGKFDSYGHLNDDGIKKELREVIESLGDFARKLKK